MQKNYIFFILSAVLFIEQTFGETELTPSGKAFRDEAIAKFALLTEEPFKLGKKLLEDIYADKPSNPFVTRHAIAALRALEEIEDEEDLSKISVFLTFSVVFDVASGSIIADDKESKEKILAVKTAFENHDAKSVANEFHKRFDEFLEWLALEFEAKRDKLNSEEKSRVKMLMELFRSFKDETNLAMKQSTIVVFLAKLQEN